MLILGNGKSRKAINLNKVYQEKVGCNAVYRDTYTDYLVCCDKRMVKQALSYGHPQIYTRQRWANDFNDLSVNPLPDLPYIGTDRKDDDFHWGSGPYAVLLGCTLSNNLKLIGFDLYSSDGYVNNMYAGTDGYKSKDSSAVDCSYWIYQIAKLFEIFYNTKFTIYNEKDWVMPKSWNLPNVSLDNIKHL